MFYLTIALAVASIVMYLSARYLMGNTPLTKMLGAVLALIVCLNALVASVNHDLHESLSAPAVSSGTEQAPASAGKPASEKNTDEARTVQPSSPKSNTEEGIYLLENVVIPMAAAVLAIWLFNRTKRKNRK